MSLVEFEWLVEIRLRDGVPSVPALAGNGRIVGYEEVLAPGERDARPVAFDQFLARSHYEPVTRRKLAEHRISAQDCCAADAVQL